MPFKRNDWVCTSATPGTRFADIHLEPGESLATVLQLTFSWAETDPLPLEERFITRRHWSEGWPGLSEPGWQEDNRLAQCHCKGCGELMLRNRHSSSWKADLCSRCQRELKRQESRQSAKAYRERNQKPVIHDPKPCAHCGEHFTPQRTTAKFCSSVCRVASHRAATS
jgi:hypothetical protein